MPKGWTSASSGKNSIKNYLRNFFYLFSFILVIPILQCVGQDETERVTTDVLVKETEDHNRETTFIQNLIEFNLLQMHLLGTG